MLASVEDAYTLTPLFLPIVYFLFIQAIHFTPLLTSTSWPGFSPNRSSAGACRDAPSHCVLWRGHAARPLMPSASQNSVPTRKSAIQRKRSEIPHLHFGLFGYRSHRVPAASHTCRHTPPHAPHPRACTRGIQRSKKPVFGHSLSASSLWLVHLAWRHTPWTVLDRALLLGAQWIRFLCASARICHRRDITGNERTRNCGTGNQPLRAVRHMLWLARHSTVP